MDPKLSLDDITSRLRAAMAATLPGAEAQARMAPRPRPGWIPDTVPGDAREGAGLILLYPRENEPHLVLTVRRPDLPHHPGQVSLPGGAREPGEGRAEAALREAHEEVGVDPAAVRVLGELTRLHIPVSGFVLHPVVGRVDRRPALRPDDSEVARILEVSLRTLGSPSTLRRERRRHDGVDYDVPFFRVDGETVWGATAMVLAEFLTILGHPPSPFAPQK
jgi:8-oxo-dGTP pyrophosphatase MutT (NUDIX family)